MRRIEGGDERNGFEVLVDKVDRIVHMKLSGVWTVPLVNEFCARILDIAREFAGKEWGIVADSTHFGAQSPEVSRIRQETIAKVRTLGCTKIAAVVSTAIYTMQFRRITEESHVGSAVFQDENAALEWLRVQKPRGR